MYFIGVDSGRQGTRTVVLDLDAATVVARSDQAHGAIPGLPAGHCEQAPEDWIRALDHTIRDCLLQLGADRSRVAGLGVSGQAQGLVLLDSGNRVVRPAKLREDCAAVGQSEEISRAFGGAPGLIELCGNPMRPSYPAAKLLWLRQREPSQFQRVASVLSPHDFINYWLSGEKRSEFGEGSQTGLFNIRERRWCREVCEFVDPSLEGLLPPVRSSKEPLGVLRRDLAASWGLEQEVVISAGGPREMMAALGAGIAAEGVLSISIGDAATVSGVSNEPVIDSRGEMTACCDATDRWMVMAGNSAALSCATQFQRLYGWGEEEIEGALNATDPGAGGLLLHPGSSGVGSGGGPARRGALVGIDPMNLSASNLMRAAMEAVALELGRGVGRMRELGLAPAEVRLSGNQAGRASWRQLLADVLGLPVLRARADSSPALGAALQSAVTFFHQCGENLTYSEMASYAVEPDERSLCVANPERQEQYRRILGRQERLIESLRDGAL